MFATLKGLAIQIIIVMMIIVIIIQIVIIVVIIIFIRIVIVTWKCIVCNVERANHTVLLLLL